MEWGTWAGLLTAFFTMVTAIGGMVATFKIFIPNFQVNKETHTIVNQQRTDMLRFQTVLVNELTKHGLDVPLDQSTLD